jgi:L-asparaginase
MFPELAKVLEAILNIPNLKGIVLENYGAGNAPTEDWFLNLLRKVLTGLHIVNVHNALAEVSIWDNMRPVQA